ncbi:phage tail-collar fiber domain-containing protein [Rahnella aceris]|uniref:phage tail-collar fiber domain-containing protein n=1 Tax=Rahnella sp. (strain Y9602) TaxID=2703885 RepID=UPI001C2750E0|nr:phage tail protein [Rahnella aceris]MBU9850083.1 phage tail protein [Rahnella aceris]
MATYKALLTTAGAAKIAAATAGGTQVKITRMAVGDGGGKLPTPDPKQTKLVNEVYRANLNRLSIDAKNSHYLVAELVIQPDVGGFWMREMGLYDADGVLIAVSNMAESYKPQLAEGSGRLQTLRMVLIVSEIESIALSIDGSTVMATKDYVDDKLAAHEKSRNHPDGTLTAKGFVQLNSSVSSTSETLAATPKAVKAANDNANTRVPSTRKVNSKALSDDITLTAADVGALPVVSAVLGTANINTFNLAKIGVYVQSTGANATVANGYPAGSQAAGVLEVIPASWTGGVLQRYTVQNTGMVWTRALNASWNGTDGPWRDWVQVSAVNSVTVPSAILTTTDINTLGFASGAGSAALYAQPKNANATAALHYPQGIAGTLYVTPSAYGCQQMYVTFTGNIWNRGLSADWNGVDGPWKEWVPTYSANNRPTAADVGAWTAAQSAASEKALADEVATAFKIRANLTATDSPNTIRGSAMFGHYGVPGAAAATTDKGYPMNGFVGVIFVTWGPNATQQIAFNNNGRQFTRAATGAWNGADGPWSAWVEVYSPNNKPTAADVGALPVTGTAAAATKLATARKIAGVAFDGTSDISLSAANVGALPSGGTAVAATKLATARKIAGVAFDGTQDIGLDADDVGAFPRVGGDVNGRVTANYLRAITIPQPGNGQGTYLGWNESGGQGESNFVNNRGGGVGGFKFRIVNQGNTVQTGEMTLSGNGDSNTSGTVNEMGQRVFSPNNRQPVNTNTANLGGGWWRCGDTGMIKQWGVVNKGSRGWSTVNFPIPFPSTCVNVQVTAINGGGGTFNDNFGTAQIINNVGFTCGQDSAGSYWEATGW